MTTLHEPVVDIRGLTKRYGSHVAVDGVDLAVGRGEIVGILGPNGAGKTTLVECAQGLRRPDAGRVDVLGLDPTRHRARLASRIGCQLQSAELPDRMRVGEAVVLFSDGAPARRAVDRWGLGDLWHKPFGVLSGGQRQRLFVALALLNEPELVFLDELTQGLDPPARRQTWQLIAEIRERGTTVVLVTHFADEAEALCDRLTVIRDGHVVAVGAPTELVDRHSRGVTLTFTDPAADLPALRSIDGVLEATATGPRVEVVGTRELIVRVGAYLSERERAGQAVPPDLRVSEPSLEDALATLTVDAAPCGGSGREAPEPAVLA